MKSLLAGHLGHAFESFSQAGYKKQLLQKWLAVLDAAHSCDASVLVVPDAGCGVFHNPPEDVGAAFGKALATFGNRWKVLISFPGGKAGEAFAKAAMAHSR